jgi:hypothetical protein
MCLEIWRFIYSLLVAAMIEGERLIITERYDALAEFELWRFDGESTEHAVIPVGPRGNKARAMEAPGSRAIHRFQARTHIDLMAQYYAHMDWGDYTSDWPDHDCVPYFYTYAMETMAALPKTWNPVREFKIIADGSTRPKLPGPAVPRISVQDGAVIGVDVWIFGDFGGYGEPPLNAEALMGEAQDLIARTKPHLFKRKSMVSLICPHDMAQRMLWVPLKRGV